MSASSQTQSLFHSLNFHSAAVYIYAADKLQLLHQYAPKFVFLTAIIDTASAIYCLVHFLFIMFLVFVCEKILFVNMKMVTLL